MDKRLALGAVALFVKVIRSDWDISRSSKLFSLYENLNGAYTTVGQTKKYQEDLLMTPTVISFIEVYHQGVGSFGVGFQNSRDSSAFLDLSYLA